MTVIPWVIIVRRAQGTFLGRKKIQYAVGKISENTLYHKLPRTESDIPAYLWCANMIMTIRLERAVQPGAMPEL